MFLNQIQTLIRIGLVVYWVGLFVGTHVPTVPTGVAAVNDKLLHYLAYGGLAFLLAADGGARGRFSWRRAALLLGGIACYGILDELLQIPVDRTADVHDWIADVLGAVCGLTAYALVFFATMRFHQKGDPPRETP